MWYFLLFCRIASDQDNQNRAPSYYFISYWESIFHLLISDWRNRLLKNMSYLSRSTCVPVQVQSIHQTTLVWCFSNIYCNISIADLHTNVFRFLIVSMKFDINIMHGIEGWILFFYHLLFYIVFIQYMMFVWYSSYRWDVFTIIMYIIWWCFRTNVFATVKLRKTKTNDRSAPLIS